MSVKKVLVTGVTGRTGSLVLRKLREYPEEFEAVGFARSSNKVEELFGSKEGLVFGDIKDRTSIEKAIVGCQALVILTSSVPKMKGTSSPGQRPEFGFEEGETPEEVDYHGQKNQIDAAVASGVEHIVLVGSMGGTNENHPLNRIGNGNILIWKRCAEQYLIDSGIDYTIIRPGGLLDEPGGVRELIVGKNDTLSTNPPNGVPSNIPRMDVAELVVQALRCPEARNKAFDVISFPASESPTAIDPNFSALFAQTTPGL